MPNTLKGRISFRPFKLIESKCTFSCSQLLSIRENMAEKLARVDLSEGPTAPVEFLVVYISCCRLQTLYRIPTDRIPILPIDRHFVFLTDSCFYMVHFGLGHFFSESRKNSKLKYFNFDFQRNYILFIQFVEEAKG